MSARIRFFLNLAIQVMRPLVERTETKIDDGLVDLAEVIRDDDWLARWFAGEMQRPPGVLAIEQEPPEETLLALRRRGINWLDLLKNAPQLIATVRTLMQLFAR